MVSEQSKGTRHTLMDGRLRVYKRPGSPYWQCYTFLGGRSHRKTLKESSLIHAKELATDWYLGLMGKLRSGQLAEYPTFKAAAAKFLEEYPVLVEGQRSPQYIELLRLIIDVHLLPFLGPLAVTEVTPAKVQEYRIHRFNTIKTKKTPAYSTIQHELTTIRHVLRTAVRHGWMSFLPDLSEPFKRSRKISHRAWFSDDEYEALYTATRKRAKHPLKERWRAAGEDLHDLVLFMANTGLRPDEVKQLQDRDIVIVADEASGETILEIKVRGKRGVRVCKSMPRAVRPLARMRERHQFQPQDLVFPDVHRELFNTILGELGLKVDREGNRRSLYSLRHTYACFRLLQGADIYNVAKNMGTGVDMIEKHYAAHLKNTIDAAAVNVRRPKVKQPEVVMPTDEDDDT